MKKESKKDYLAPHSEVIEINVELGFSGSQTEKLSEDLGEW